MISDCFINAVPTKDLHPVDDINSNQYQDISLIINKVERKSINEEIEVDIFQITEQLLHNLNAITSSMNLMTTASNELTENMTKRTVEINKYTHIKDVRLRMQKLETVTNLLAEELDLFNSKMRVELPVFSENYLPIGPSYSQIRQYAANFKVDEVDVMKSSMSDFRDTIVGTVTIAASLLNAMMEWPPATSKFNRIKRETEIVLKDITKEMLEGLKLMDEALKE